MNSSLLNTLIVQPVVKTNYSRVDKVTLFNMKHAHLSALGVHDEGLKVRVQIRHEGVDKVLDGGSFLQHAWT